MSREIKFRAWDENNDRWLESDMLAVVNGGLFLFTGWHEPPDELPPMTYTLMQYTGLKDKNGVEIYEGDILGYFWLEKLNKYYDQVPVISEQGSFVLYIDGLAFHKALDLRHYAHKSEVIGNIYENPELLERSL